MIDLSLLETIFAVYLFLALAKAMLCYASIPTAMGVIVNKNRKDSCIFWLVGLGVGIPLYTFIALPVLLWQEKASFFGMYSKHRVMKEVAGVL